MVPATEALTAGIEVIPPWPGIYLKSRWLHGNH